MEMLSVSLGERAYPISIGSDQRGDVRTKISALARAGRRSGVLTDRNLATRQAEALQAMFGDTPILVLAPGEETKSLAELGKVLDFLAAQSLDRTGVLWAVGGGVIGDLGGFADCTACLTERRQRLQRMNLWQRPEPAIHCSRCAGSAT